MKWFRRSCCTSTSAENQKKISVGLVGNPNCGKTTLFNALTGACQRVGNWPGVTVERKSGFFTQNDTTVEVIDLPGVYSLTAISNTSSIDEKIACETILKREVDIVVNVLDAANLERNLYLTLQLLEMRIPVIIAINMMDIAKKRGLQIQLEALKNQLGCHVVSLEADKNMGVDQLKKIITFDFLSCQSMYQPSKPAWQTDHLLQAIASVKQSISLDTVQTEFLALRLLENDIIAEKEVHADTLVEVKKQQGILHAKTGEEADIVIADARYRYIGMLLSQCLQKKNNSTQNWTQRIDKIILNRFLGLPIFLVVMYAMFFFAINVGGAFQDFFDMTSHAILVEGMANVLQFLHLPAWLIALLANGIGKGINTVITFIPVISAMFFFLALLEDSGYMSRAAFVIDRFMRMMGLPGKSFVPMIVGFGCNVPGVMATRTLENKRDRILTVMMSPFMSCSARLAIYAVFAAAFFPAGGQNIIFALYVIGIAMAMLTGLLLRKTLLQGDPAPLVMELPPYHFPKAKALCKLAWQRLKGFLFRAGKLILPVCIVVGVLNTLNFDGTLNTGEGDVHSILSYIGQWMTPIFSPMGLSQDNWPATVGLVTGVLAKEVVVGTLNSLYAQLAHVSLLQSTGLGIWDTLSAAFMSIPHNLLALGQSLWNPVMAKAPMHSLTQGVYGAMYQRFDGQVGAFAYLLFVLLYFPCVSTTAAMIREVNRRWALFSVAWTTGIAYCAAVSFYQVATFLRHPFSSLCWVGGISFMLTFVIMAIRLIAEDNQPTKRGDYEFA